MTTIDAFLGGLAARLKRTPGPSDLTDAHVSEAEQVLGLRLPPGYRKLVTSCRRKDVPDAIYWLGDDVPRGVSMFRRKEDMPVAFLIPVSCDGSGDEFCFDTRETNAAGEYAIVRWEHEIHDEHSTHFERLWPDLGAFLLPSLTLPVEETE